MNKLISTKHSLAYRNMLNTDYKIWVIEMNIPIIGRAINTWLYKHHMSAYTFKKDSNFKNRVSYVRRWYRK